MGAVHNCAKCDLPLAEQICQLGCTHVYHEICLVAFILQKASNCGVCRKFIKNVKVLDTSEERGNCPICIQSLDETAKRLDAFIFQGENGQKFHQGCFPENEIPKSQTPSKTHLQKHPNPLPQIGEDQIPSSSESVEERDRKSWVYINNVLDMNVRRFFEESPNQLAIQEVSDVIVDIGRVAYLLCFPDHSEDLATRDVKQALRPIVAQRIKDVSQTLQNSLPVIECDEYVENAIAIVAIFLVVSAIAYILNLALFAGADPILNVIGFPIGSIFNLLR